MQYLLSDFVLNVSPAHLPADIYRDPGTAGVLSAIWPGAGQIYAGRVGRGIGWFFATMLGTFPFVIPGFIFWALGIADAARLAREENQKMLDLQADHNRASSQSLFPGSRE